MTDEETRLFREMADKRTITELLYRYCRSVDRCDAPLGHTIWHDDATVDYPDFTGGGTAVIDHICQQHRFLLHHTHQLSNILITLDGDRAGSETYVTATMRAMMKGKLMQIGVWGRYIDRWSMRDGRWAMDHRRVILEFDDLREAQPMQHYDTGKRDRSDLSYEVLGTFAL